MIANTMPTSIPAKTYGSVLLQLEVPERLPAAGVEAAHDVPLARLDRTDAQLHVQHDREEGEHRRHDHLRGHPEAEPDDEQRDQRHLGHDLGATSSGRRLRSSHGTLPSTTPTTTPETTAMRNPTIVSVAVTRACSHVSGSATTSRRRLDRPSTVAAAPARRCRRPRHEQVPARRSTASRISGVLTQGEQVPASTWSVLLVEGVAQLADDGAELRSRSPRRCRADGRSRPS